MTCCIEGEAARSGGGERLRLETEGAGSGDVAFTAGVMLSSASMSLDIGISIRLDVTAGRRTRGFVGDDFSASLLRLRAAGPVDIAGLVIRDAGAPVPDDEAATLFGSGTTTAGLGRVYHVSV